MARNDIHDFLHGLVSSEKIASEDLSQLSLDELEALMGVETEEEKVAYAMACGPSDENWLQQFSYTELYDKAIALAEKELTLEREELKQRLARKRTIIDDSLWNKRDQLRLEKDQLVLELHKKKAKDQKKNSPAKVASNGDPLREQKARTGKLKKAEEVEYTGQVNNGEPQAPEWPRAALGVDAAGRKATPEELKPQTSVKDPDAQHVEPHADGVDFVKKVSALVVKMAGISDEMAKWEENSVRRSREERDEFRASPVRRGLAGGLAGGALGAMAGHALGRGSTAGTLLGGAVGSALGGYAGHSMGKAVREAQEKGRKKTSADLTEAKRDDLGKKQFALPKQRKFPIHDEAHARNALARAAQFGSPSVQAKVRSAVSKKYPGIDLTSASKPEKPTVKASITKAAAMFGAPLMRVSEIAAHTPKSTTAGLEAAAKGIARKPPPIPVSAVKGAPSVVRHGPMTPGGIAAKARREADLSALEAKLMGKASALKMSIMGGIAAPARLSGYIAGGARQVAQSAGGGLARAASTIGKKTITGMPAEGVVHALQQEGVRRAVQSSASHPLLGGMAEAGRRMRATASPFRAPMAVQPPPLSMLMGG